MKRALIIATVSGFLFRFEREDVRLLQEMGYEVHYAANMDDKNYYYTNEDVRKMHVKMHHIPILKSPFCLKENKEALHQVVDIVKKEDIQLIHCHTPVGGVLGRLTKIWCPNVKVIYTAHGFHYYKGAEKPRSMVFHMAEWVLAHFSDSIVVINEEDYKNAQKLPVKKKGKIYKIPGVGLDMDAFSPFTDEERKKSRKKFGIPDGVFFMLCVGELNENKNQHAVLKTLDEMRNSGKDMSRIRLGICGDGAWREYVEEWIRELDLEDIVTMYGYYDPIQEILGCADAMIFPSRREGLGMAALESLSMGVPVIAADNRGTREYMVHKENGWVCGADDTSGYAQGISYLMELDENSRYKMKEYCRNSVKRFKKSETVSIMRDVYRDADAWINNGACK